MDLESFRKHKGLTQLQAARALGLRSKSAISMIESGRSPPSAELAGRIQEWSNGQVTAAELRPDLAKIFSQAAPA